MTSYTIYSSGLEFDVYRYVVSARHRHSGRWIDNAANFRKRKDAELYIERMKRECKSHHCFIITDVAETL